MTRSTGLIVPSMFETHVRETTLVRSVTSVSRSSRSRRPSSVTPNQRSVAPVRSVSSCHGTMLEWCSISEMTTSSPSPTVPASPSTRATRFSASDAFLVNTTSSRRPAPMKPATLVRPSSNASLASAPSWCIARATFALCCR